jgi:hypothetical protein
MRHSTTKRRAERPEDEDSSILLPDKNFLGASETDIIAIEREVRPRTTTRRRADPNRPERRSR